MTSVGGIVRRSKPILDLLLVVPVVALFAASALPLLETQWWAFRLLAFPRLPELIAIVSAMGFVAIFVRRRGLLKFALESLSLVALAINGWILWPYASIHGTEPMECDEAFRLTVMVANVQLGNRRSDDLIAMVQRQKPDLFVAMETDEWWLRKLQVLTKAMPHIEQRSPVPIMA